RWEDFGEAGAIFRGLRSPQGEQMVLDDNLFVEGVLPRGVLRKLSDAEMAAYRAPFLMREARLPTLAWPRQIPIEGEPADITAVTVARGGLGGFPLGFAIALFGCLISNRRLLTGVSLVVAVVGAATLARIQGLVLDGSTAYNLGLLRPEFALLVLSTVGIILERRRVAATHG